MLANPLLPYVLKTFDFYRREDRIFLNQSGQCLENYQAIKRLKEIIRVINTHLETNECQHKSFYGCGLNSEGFFFYISFLFFSFLRNTFFIHK